MVVAQTKSTLQTSWFMTLVLQSSSERGSMRELMFRWISTFGAPSSWHLIRMYLIATKILSSGPSRAINLKRK